MQITYQKRDGTIIQKLRKTMPSYEIGEITSMGWKLLCIKYEYKGKFYPEYEYKLLIQKSKSIAIRKRQIKDLFLDKFKTLLYYIIGIIILYYIKIRIGI